MTHKELLDAAQEEIRIGNHIEALRLANIVCTETLPKTEMHCEASLCIADTERTLGHHDHVQSLVEQTLSIANEFGYELVKARAYTILGIMYMSLSELPRALDYLTKSLDIFTALGDTNRAVLATSNIGMIYQELADYTGALAYMNKALADATRIDNKESVARISSTIGTVYFALSDYPRALEYMSNGFAVLSELGQEVNAARVSSNIGNIYAELSDYTLALEYYTKSLKILTEAGDKAWSGRILNNIGNIYYLLADYPLALETMLKALVLHNECSEKYSAALVTGNIGLTYLELQDYSLAMEYMHRALDMYLQIGESAGVAGTTGSIGLLYARKNFDGYDPKKAEEYLLKAASLNEQLGTKRPLLDNYFTLAGVYEHEKRWEDFAVFFKKYHYLKEEVQSEEAKNLAEKYDNERREAEREKQIALERAATQARIDEQQKLLHNVLPPTIADKILGGRTLIAEKLPSVSVLFADIVNFTKLSQRITPEELVEGLDRIFSAFDNLAEKYGLEKIKTIGDAYMVVSGAPLQREEHAQAMALFAIEMLEAMKEFRSISTGEEIQLRIGIHSGEVVAGVIGKKKFAYDLWGDAVNTASRMESHGEPGKIHVSEEFKQAFLLGTGRQGQPQKSPTSPMSPLFTNRGEMDIKGKGMMKTYFLEKSTT
ncbi:MAG: tetratricopeptide repeat protein [Ignavibacteria bacterium]|nr:tetratricopeptide repeat protein [Ignavibacteria bacterium]